MNKHVLALACPVLVLVGCRRDAATPKPPPLFSEIAPAHSGVHFNNEIQRFESDSLNALDYDPLYNGAGLGVADFNGDGLQDLFFAGNLVPCRLYLNRGDFRFDDVTEKAGIRTAGKWCTGVSIADVNRDGRPDVYVCVAGKDTSARARANLLFINIKNESNGTPVFEESAAAYGLADAGFSSQAAFFDYDRDGDLDCYILNNAVERTGRNTIRPKRVNGQGPSNDRLYRNESAAGSPQSAVHSRQSTVDSFSRRSFSEGGPQSSGSNNEPAEGHENAQTQGRLKTEDRQLKTEGRQPKTVFTDVTRQAGILKEGYGLGVCISDLDQDGWSDVYCANDFLSNDLVWSNHHDGTFTDRAAEYFKHTSYNSMGVDVADINNDALPDVCVVDMLPEPSERRNMMLIKTNWDFFRLAREMGYQDQYVRNVLQLNRGQAPSPAVLPKGRETPPPGPGPRFSEIGQLAGIFATDWSWAPLLADLDNDGYRDLVVSNGYRRDITNLDYVVYLNETVQMEGNNFSPATRRKLFEELYRLPEIKLHNYVYRNRGDLTFENKSLEWGLGEPTYSNGAAYADLDNDGDLDLIFNNIDAPAGLYRNNLVKTDSTGHFLRFRLEAPGTLANAAKLRVSTFGPAAVGTVLAENSVVRGYLSSVEPLLHVGLGACRQWRVEVEWSNGERQEVPADLPDSVYTVRYSADAVAAYPRGGAKPLSPLFTELPADATGLVYHHTEKPYDEFKRTYILPHLFSRNSPGIAVADADGNGLDDVFVGADPGFDRSLFLQTSPGQFQQRVQGKNDLEDHGAVFFDADGDGDADLYVVSGGAGADGEHALYQDRLYRNDGTGKLTRDPGALPPILSSGSTVAAADFDHDGDLDLFRGGRVLPGQYPAAPRSFLLAPSSSPSDRVSRAGPQGGEARFSDVTASLCPELQNPGLVTTALWTDYDNDTWPDLLVAGEFMPIMVFHNEQGKRLTRVDAPGLRQSAGQWNSLVAADFDRDGDMDYLAGNLGLNNKFHVTAETPMRVYAADFDENGSVDPVLTYYLGGKEQVSAIRDALNEQMPVKMKKRFTTYAAFAQADFSDVLTRDERQRALVVEAGEVRSCYVENLGHGDFRLHPLPVEAQFSPVFGLLTDDFNGDGFTDALLVGNSRAPETYSGWYDASLGTVLLGDGAGHFRVAPFASTGFCADGDAKALAAIFTGTDTHLAVTNNDGPLQLFRPNRAGGRVVPVPRGAVAAQLEFPDGKIQRVEFPVGSGYLSQSSRVLRIPQGGKNVYFFEIRGQRSPYGQK